MSDLSLKEVRMLAKCIKALEDLESGRRPPRSALQKRFLRVCRGEVPAVTEYEKAYLKWRRSKPDLFKLEQSLLGKSKEDREQKRRRELGKIEQQSKEREALELARQGQIEPKRFIEEWGTRDDYKRDRGSWRRR